MAAAAMAAAASVHVNGLSSSQGDGFSVYLYYYVLLCTLNYLGTPRDCIFSLLIHFFVFFIIKGNGDTVLKVQNQMYMRTRKILAIQYFTFYAY